jgi:protease-4
MERHIVNDVNEQNTMLVDLVRDAMTGNRKKRLWDNIFRFSFLLYFVSISFSALYLSGMDTTESIDESHVGYINIHGAIARNGGVNAFHTIEALNTAFKSENTKAIVLDADSGGGSPSESDKIYKEILRLKLKYPEKKVYATVGDGCMSGCYYIISAADEILANETSLIGSIGVKMEAFGFVDVMEKIGVERRTLSAGAHKTMLDAYSPRDLEAESHILSKVLNKTHETFIQRVKEGRGDKLKSDDVFNGLVWSGVEAKKLGLVDGYGSLHEVARSYSDEAYMHDYTVKDRSLKALFSGITSEVLFNVIANANTPKIN